MLLMIRSFKSSSVAPNCCVRLLLIGLLAGLVGCGGSEPDPAAQAAAPAPASGGGGGGGEAVGALSSEEGYGNEGYANESGGGNAGYGGGNSAYGGGGMGEGEDEEGYNSAYAGGGGGMGRGAMGGPGAGYPGNMGGGMGGSGYGGEGAYGGEGSYGEGGYGGGMAGMGGMGGMAGGAPNAGSMIQFVRQNCVMCHGPQQSKGGLRLDGLTGNFSDTTNATKWHEAMLQLEAGTMPPAAVQRRPDPRQQAEVVAWVKNSLASASFVPVDQQDYLAQAKHAFSSGKYDEARTLAFAHAVAAEPDASQELLSQVKFFALGPRPAFALRFAVGVELKAASTITDLKPLGSKQFGGAGGGGGGGGYGGEGGFSGRSGGGGTDSDEDRSYQDLTGDFGEALADAFESRWSAGDLGTVFNNVEVKAATEPAPGARGGYGGGGYGGEGGMASGMFGGGGYGGEGAGAGPGATSRKTIKAGDPITNGLVFLGTGSQTDLLDKAAKEGVDGLFLFDINVVQNRMNSIINNSTRLRLITLDGKAVAATSTLVNTEVERDEMRGTGGDPLQKNIDRLFTLFDEKVRLTDLPNLSPANAQDRIRQLLIAKDVSDLNKMFEAKLYHFRGWLNDDELAKIYQIVMRANDGVALASGTADDRKLVMEELLTH